MKYNITFTDKNAENINHIENILAKCKIEYKIKEIEDNDLPPVYQINFTTTDRKILSILGFTPQEIADSVIFEPKGRKQTYRVKYAHFKEDRKRKERDIKLLGYYIPF